MSKMFEEVMDSFPDIYICWKDTESVFRGCNKNFADLLGMTKEEIIGMKDEAAPQIEDDRKVLESGRSKPHYKEILTLPNGVKKPIVTHKGIWKDSEGKPLGIVVCFFLDYDAPPEKGL